MIPNAESIGQIIDLASRKAVEQTDWNGRVLRNRDGGVHPTVANALVIFANDPALNGMLAFNSFTSQRLLMRPPPLADPCGKPMPGPYPRSCEEEDASLIHGYFQRVWTPQFRRSAVTDALAASAYDCRFHPVVDWLNTLQWDGKARLDRWLSNAFDCEDNRYHRAVGAKLLIAAVARVKVPGCKFDHMVILEGKQGIGKSTALRKLFGEDWFSDSIHADLANRDAAITLQGLWCVEFSEIDHIIRNEIDTVKAFLSRQVDRFVPRYGKNPVDRPRQGVLLGTTNKDDYLRDETGNRRFWPAYCRSADVGWIELNRDQLWAEAAHRQARGETIWLDDEEVIEQATGAQAARLQEDLWQPVMAEWLFSRVEVRLNEVLTGAIGMPAERQDKRAENRAGGIMRALGWTRGLARRGGKPGRIWRAPGSDNPPEPETTFQPELAI